MNSDSKFQNLGQAVFAAIVEIPEGGGRTPPPPNGEALAKFQVRMNICIAVERGEYVFMLRERY